MIQNFLDFPKALKDGFITISLPSFENLLKCYSFHLFTEESNLDEILPNLTSSKVIIVNKCEMSDNISKHQFIIASFEKTIIIFEESSISILDKLFYNNKEIKVCFLSDAKDIKNHTFINDYHLITDNPYIEQEIKEFSERINFKLNNGKKYWEIMKIILPFIIRYLIENGYEKLRKDRVKNIIQNLYLNKPIKNVSNNNFIEIRHIGNGSSFQVFLVYSIEDEELYVIKKPYNSNQELIKRVCENCTICHPFMSQLVGVNFNQNYLIAEYIDGLTLKKIDHLELSKTDKIKIIIEIISAIQSIHEKHLIFRDLSPSNIIIDHNKDAVIIDFDRMIEFDKYKNKTLDDKFTCDFNDNFTAPEVDTGTFSYECDIYSLGKMIYYILVGKIPLKNEEDFKKCPEIEPIYKKCTKIDPKERPSIQKLTYEFIKNYCTLFLKDDPRYFYVQNVIGNIYSLGEEVQRDVNKAIQYYSFSAKENFSNAQYNLGRIYYDDEYAIHDIEKAIYYFSLAANQNNPDALYRLALIYQDDIEKYINYLQLAAENGYEPALNDLFAIYSSDEFGLKNISKSSQYYKQASNSIDPKVHYSLGCIFYYGIYVEKDIEKSIYHYKRAAELHSCISQYNLGAIYLNGLEYIKPDIDKSIYYFSLAAEQNFVDAQFTLGMIYSKIVKNISKSIYYYEAAAKQNNLNAQYNLGNIYVKSDIDKAIYYYSLAADQNDADSLYQVGKCYIEKKDNEKALHYLKLAAKQNHKSAIKELIHISIELGNKYYKGWDVSQDINKAIHYYEFAAENSSSAQRILGCIYWNDKNDVNLAIHYFKLSAEQNDKVAQFNLGRIYFEGQFVNINMNKAIKYFTCAAEQNMIDAQIALGNIYAFGSNIPKDIEKSKYYLLKAANQKNPEALYLLGSIYSDTKFENIDINKAISYFSLAANLDLKKSQSQYIIESQFNLGIIYLQLNIDKSIHYLTLAAENNHVKAQSTLGCLYCEGTLFNKDIDKGIYYLELAGKQNDPFALYNLGSIYCDNDYGKKNVKKAIFYYSHSAKLNDPKAQNDLGVFLIEGKDIEKDIKSGLEYLHLSANQNWPQAQHNIGFIYFEGKYVPKDIDKSIYYFKLAAKQKHPNAQFDLGNIYYNGMGVPRDTSLGIRYFTLAANENNFVHSQYILGIIYYKGEFVSQDFKKSIYYFKLAANQNDSSAQNYLGIIYMDEKYDKHNINIAIHYFLLSASHSNTDALFNLSLIYSDGIYVKQDIEKSIHYCKLAANLNNSDAQLNLGIFYLNILNKYYNVKKGIHFLTLSSNNENRMANFSLGYLYHTGLYVNEDVDKAIKLYKDSLVKIEYARNNLGVLYMGNSKKNLPNAIEYFNEAIQKNDDLLSMINLANIYFFEKDFKNIDKSIELLIKSCKYRFTPSLEYLCLALITKYKFDYQSYALEIEKYSSDSIILVNLIESMILLLHLYEDINYQKHLLSFQNNTFLYNESFRRVSSNDIIQLKNKAKQKNKNFKNLVDINKLFYEGFGIL
ncbi:hypothetical protein M9Y10_030633 [Tritrichomonas musculus]|uniref:Protein kinase domain-containing protein n=1 Tax=Tritrichomonas musculus TaxID=1915356 RepID=A0ABR2H2K9_9EUKA